MQSYLFLHPRLPSRHSFCLMSRGPTPLALGVKRKSKLIVVGNPLESHLKELFKPYT